MHVMNEQVEGQGFFLKHASTGGLWTLGLRTRSLQLGGWTALRLDLPLTDLML